VDSFLKKNPLFPKNVEEFITGFEKYCTENSKFKKLLTHSKVENISHTELNSSCFLVPYCYFIGAMSYVNIK